MIARVLGCRAGKDKRCERLAGQECTRTIRRCCRKNPLETCCGAGTYGGGGPGDGDGGGATTTTTTSPGATTTTVPALQACTTSADCAGFACCNLAQGRCCVLGSGSAACSNSGPTPILAGAPGCTSYDGVTFPETPEQCGPTRPATCPPEAVNRVGFQCHVCGDQAKILQSLYDSQTGARTPLHY